MKSFEPMTAHILPRRGARFSLSQRERAGVRENACHFQAALANSSTRLTFHPLSLTLNPSPAGRGKPQLFPLGFANGFQPLAALALLVAHLWLIARTKRI
ncbi:MAG: hypothetical protein RLZZ350_920 [Verrucomicrobiota bacterium]|jgi:hypothetical protein